MGVKNVSSFGKYCVVNKEMTPKQLHKMGKVTPMKKRKLQHKVGIKCRETRLGARRRY